MKSIKTASGPGFSLHESNFTETIAFTLNNSITKAGSHISVIFVESEALDCKIISNDSTNTAGKILEEGKARTYLATRPPVFLDGC